MVNNLQGGHEEKDELNIVLNDKLNELLIA